MKKVIEKNELRITMSKTVNLLCDAVSKTLGPTGNNVLIDSSETTPFFTNDGVTIATNIESDDKVENTILEIVKEASLKTNELVGDGTTTTLVLLQSIFNLGLEEINKGKNEILLKNELIISMNKVIKRINELKRIPTKNDLLNIALTSTNDLEIASLTTNTFFKTKSKHAIKLEESNNESTYTIHKKGYNISINNISSMYFSKENNLEIKNCNILILKGYLDNLESISEIINDILENNKNLIIFVESMNEEIKNEILVYYFQKKNIFIVEIAEYASHRDKIEEDIKTLTNSTIKNIDYENAYTSDLGYINSITLNKNEITLLSNNKNNLELIKTIKKELKECNNDYEKEFINNRLSKLQNGITTIFVGGITKSEKRERLMRFEDALCALSASKDGIVYGEGITYLKAKEVLNEKLISDSILKKSLEKPFEKVIENLGIDSYELKKEIINNNYQKIYDYKTNSLIDINNCNILDPLEVVVTSLKNSVSIASLLLTTSSLVINENYKQEKDIL